MLTVRYSVGGGFAGRALERASAGTARREVARAMERFAARFARATPPRVRAGTWPAPGG
jgi:hypothetical protein